MNMNPRPISGVIYGIIDSNSEVYSYIVVATLTEGSPIKTHNIIKIVPDELFYGCATGVCNNKPISMRISTFAVDDRDAFVIKIPFLISGAFNNHKYRTFQALRIR